MNIFHIVSNKVWGGGEQYIYDLLLHLKKDGYNIGLFCRNYKAIINNFRKLDCRIFILPLKGFTDIFSPFSVAIKINSGSNIIHVHNFKDLFTAVLSKKISGNRKNKVIITRHLVKKGKNGFIYRWLYKNTDKIIFVSDIAKEQFFKGIPLVHNINYEVIHNSIIPDNNFKLEICDIRKIYKIDNDKAVLMFLGRIDREKGIDTLIKALKTIDKNLFHLIIAGTGDEKYIMELEAEIKKYGLQDNISFTGYIQNPQPIIKQSDIGILPSLVKEALGLANLEFMQAGKPQICSNNGAQREYLVNGKTAILIEPGNISELNNAIYDLITDIKKQREIGYNAQKKFLNDLNYTSFYKKIKSIYEEIQETSL